MALELNGTTGVSLVQDGVITDANLPAGSVLQVVSATKTDVFSTQSDTFVDVTDLGVNITPSSTNSKILIKIFLVASISSATMHTRVTGGNASNFVGDAAGTRVSAIAGLGRTFSDLGLDESAFSLSGEFLDSPSTTSSTTYQVQVRVSDNQSRTATINRPATDSDDEYRGRYISTITAMEIAG